MDLREDIWQPLTRGTTVGYRKLDRVTPVRLRGIRVTIEDAIEVPLSVGIQLYAGAAAPIGPGRR